MRGNFALRQVGTVYLIQLLRFVAAALVIPARCSAGAVIHGKIERPMLALLDRSGSIFRAPAREAP